MAGKKKHGNAKGTKAFTREERDAMRDRVREAKAAASGEGGEAAVLAAIRAMPPADRALGERIHAIVRSRAPRLTPRTWYGMPAYANAAGKVVCFFQSAHKFKARYATLGFADAAKLDDGDLWPTSFALRALTPALEDRIGALVERAVG